MEWKGKLRVTCGPRISQNGESTLLHLPRQDCLTAQVPHHSEQPTIHQEQVSLSSTTDPTTANCPPVTETTSISVYARMVFIPKKRFPVTMPLSNGRKWKIAKVLLTLQMTHCISWPLWAFVCDPWQTMLREKKVLRGQPYRGELATQGQIRPIPELISI